MITITRFQLEILQLINAKGPLLAIELASELSRPWQLLSDDLQSLRRHGFVVVLSDERYRLALAGYKATHQEPSNVA